MPESEIKDDANYKLFGKGLYQEIRDFLACNGFGIDVDDEKPGYIARRDGIKITSTDSGIGYFIGPWEVSMDYSEMTMKDLCNFISMFSENYSGKSLPSLAGDYPSLSVAEIDDEFLTLKVFMKEDGKSAYLRMRLVGDSDIPVDFPINLHRDLLPANDY